MSILLSDNDLSLLNFQSLHDFASYRGFVDAALGKPMSKSIFTYDSTLAAECRLIYELSYLLERESHLLLFSALYQTSGKIVSWNEISGWGTVEFLDVHRTIRRIPFSYHVLRTSAWDIVGLNSYVVYKYDRDGINITSVLVDSLES